MMPDDHSPLVAVPRLSDRQSSSRQRQKRIQVARACDGCRIHRIKCDNNFPCSNCNTRGRACSNNDTTKVSTLSEAHNEIGRLSDRVKELEAALRHERDNNLLLTPTHSSPSNASKYGNNELHKKETSANHWQGIQIRPPRSPHTSWFGPSSLYHYIHRLSLFLGSTLQQFHNTSDLLPPSSSSTRLFGKPAAEAEDIGQHLEFSARNSGSAEVYLTPVQEGYFINQFWETYHTSILPVINEAEFKQHYQSLWTPSGSRRKSSALVDIIVALCMQFGISSLPSNRQGSVAASEDATIAGRWHFRRGQMLLSLEAESPTISTLQCHLLCVSYLCGGSFHNMVDTACGLAVRTAYILGLHIDAFDTFLEPEIQVRRCLWWAVFLIDSKVGMKLGRPFLLDDRYTMQELPSDSHSTAMISGSTFAPMGKNTTWLSFNLQQTKLYMKIRSAHTAFYGKRFNSHNRQTIWDDAHILEEYAELMSPHVKNIEEWTVNVPDELKNHRKSGGRAFSTEDCTLEVEQFAPLWLQRQRVLLELTFHHLSINLYRPFVSFNSIPASGSLAEGIATRCAAHGVALSVITHQILSSTPILDGWHEAFQWQWSAAITLMGYITMYPQGPSVSAVRNAVDLAISVFDIFGASFAVAAGAAKIARELYNTIDLIRARRGEKPSIAGEARHFDTDIGQEYITDPLFLLEGTTGSLTSVPSNIETIGPDFLQSALDVEFWADYGMLWQNTGDVNQDLIST